MPSPTLRLLLVSTLLAGCATSVVEEGVEVSVDSPSLAPNDAPTPPPPTPDPPPSLPVAWQPFLAWTFSFADLHDGPAVSVYGCAYTIGYAVDPLAKSFDAWIYLRKSSVGGACTETTGWVLLDHSNVTPALAIDLWPRPFRFDLAVGYGRNRPTDASLQLVAVTAGGVAYRTASLPIVDDPVTFFTPPTILSIGLSPSSTGALKVTGSKDGIFVGQVGSGPLFDTKYSSFFAGSTPAHGSITAHY